jgi:hypothetical protein
MNNIFNNLPNHNISECFNYIFIHNSINFQNFYILICGKTNYSNFNNNIIIRDNNFILFNFIFIIHIYSHELFIFFNTIENNIILTVKNIIDIFILNNFDIKYWEIKNFVILFNQYKNYFDNWINDKLIINFNIISFFYNKLNDLYLKNILDIYKHLSNKFNIDINIDFIDKYSYKIFWDSLYFDFDHNINNFIFKNNPLIISILNFINSNSTIIYSFNHKFLENKFIFDLDYNNIITVLNIFNINFKFYNINKLPTIYLKLLFHLINFKLSILH